MARECGEGGSITRPASNLRPCLSWCSQRSRYTTNLPRAALLPFQARRRHSRNTTSDHESLPAFCLTLTLPLPRPLTSSLFSQRGRCQCRVRCRATLIEARGGLVVVAVECCTRTPPRHNNIQRILGPISWIRSVLPCVIASDVHLSNGREGARPQCTARCNSLGCALARRLLATRAPASRFLACGSDLGLLRFTGDARLNSIASSGWRVAL